MLQSERIADGNDIVSDLGLLGIRNGDIGQAIFRHLEHGDIRAFVGADDLGPHCPVVLQRYLDFIGVSDDMVVGQYVTIFRVDDDARAEAAHFPLLLLFGRPEEMPEEGVVKQGVLPAPDIDCTARGDVHYRRRHLLDERRQRRYRLVADFGRHGRARDRQSD